MMSTDKATDIAQAVEAKLRELDGIPYGSIAGRRLELGGKLDDGQHIRLPPAEARQQIGLYLTDIAGRLGIGFFNQAPAVVLEQLVVMSIIKNHDTAGLLKSLINSFLVAYSTPETHERAYQSLVDLEGMRAEVGEARKLAHALAMNPSTTH